MRNQYIQSVLVSIFILFSLKGNGQVDGEAVYSYAELSGSAVKSITVVDHNSTTCSQVANRGVLFAKLDFGEVYPFAALDVSAAVHFSIRAYDQTIGGNIVFDKNDTLKINNLSPENLWQYEYSEDLNTIKRFEITPDYITSTAPAGKESEVQAAINLSVAYQSTYSIDVSNNVVTNNLPTIGNPTILSWTNNNCNVFGYELQYMRLYNIRDSYAQNAQTCETVINWNEASSIHIEGNQTSISLTLSEGTGYYAWRVRPIGNLYGGFGDSRDWGNWSTPIQYMQQDYLLNITSPTSIGQNHILFYNQFDEDKNFIHSQVFSEGNRIHETIQYANGLGNLRQSQAKSLGSDFVLMSQALEDYAGRSSIAAMGVPVTTNALGYHENLLQHNGELYGPKHFDEDTNYNDPLPINGGEVANYYSDNNPDVTVPSAEGYPFARTLFYKDGLSSPKESSGVGKTHRINNDSTIISRTNRVIFADVAEMELIRVFGDEAPKASTVQKTIRLDPNKVGMVEYIGINGKTIATCLTNSDGAIHMDQLESSESVHIVDTLPVSKKSDPYTLRSSKSFGFIVPTEVVINYTFAGDEISNLCANYCATCDYNLTLNIVNLETNQKTEILNHSIGQIDCSTPATFTMPQYTKMMESGSYLLVKEITANNLNYAIESDSSEVLPYLTYHKKQVAQKLQQEMDSTLAAVYKSLDTNNWEPFEGETIDVGCGSVMINNYNCAGISSDPVACDSFNFENYFSEYLSINGTAGINSSLHVIMSNNFLGAQVNGGDVNALIQNMRNDGYDCELLQQCCIAFTMNYENAVASAELSETTYDPLKSLLNCIKPSYIRPYDYPPVDITEAHRYFIYQVGSKTACEEAIFGAVLPTNPYQMPDGDVVGYSYAVESERPFRKWEAFVNCIEGGDMEVDESDFDKAAATITSNCESACNDRYASFKSALIREYHNTQQYIQGDQYQLVLNSTPYMGQVYSFNYDLPLDTSNTIFVDTNEIFCATQNLVEHCMDYCQLSVNYDENAANISAGTEQEFDNITKATMWDFDIEFSANGTCSGGYELVAAQYDTLNDGVFTLDSSYVKIWESSNGTKGGSEAASGVINLNDGFIVFGQSQNIGLHFDIRKFDERGVLLDSAIFNSGGDDFITEVIPDGSNLIVIGLSTGYSTQFDKTDSKNTKVDKWILKLDANLNIINQISIRDNIDTNYTFAGIYNLPAKKLSNGNILIVGRTNHNNGNRDYNGIHLIEMDTDLNIVKSDSLVDPNFDINATDFVVNENTNEITVVAKEVELGGNQFAAVATYFFNLSSFSEINNSKISKSSGVVEGSYTSGLIPSITIDSIGDTYVAVACGSGQGYFTNNFGNSDLYVYKIQSSTKTVDWIKNYGGTSAEGIGAYPIRSLGIEISTNNHINVVCGSSSGIGATSNKTENSFNNSEDIWYLKLSTNDGAILGQKTFGGDGSDIGTSVKSIVKQTGQKYMLITGYSDSPISGNKTTHSQGNDLWTIAFRDYCDFDPICFKWVEPLDSIPDPIVVSEISCDEYISGLMKLSIQNQVAKLIETQLKAVEKEYNANCLSVDSIVDICTISHYEDLHHYTLYYYDRVGNLVKTVPPAGVDTSSTSRNDHPNHEYVTYYYHNSLGQLIAQETPDGGKSNFLYNNLSVLRYSQNQKQLAQGYYSYTKFDNLMRPVEVGQANQAVNPNTGISALQGVVEDMNFPYLFTEQEVYTVYNQPAVVNGLVKHPTLGAQKHLQNRISYVYNADSVFTFYSYDIHGNVKWMSEQLPELGKNFISYEYDLLTGAVQRVAYNEGRSDEFHHYYQYDAQNRITDVYTGRYKSPFFDDGLSFAKKIITQEGAVDILSSKYTTLTHDANYSYYKHGPLKRKEIGNDKIQGVDNLYTIMGWLKGINHTGLNAVQGQGPDGEAGSPFAKDVWGSVLSYFNGDFVRTGSAFNSSNAALISSQGIQNPLFNGNIAAWTSSIGNSEYTPELSGNNYRYDVLNRIKAADFSVHNGSSWQTTNQYDTKYSYDANGNLLTLCRNANGGASGDVLMDSLIYAYHSIGGKKSNQLKIVTDGQSKNGEYSNDFDTHVNNYTYDAIGNLTQDLDEDISLITWRMDGKISSVQKTTGELISFLYNAMGNRVAKKVATPSDEKVTFYARDASGNVMSNYERKEEAGMWVYRQTEIPIFGSQREGVYITYDKVITKQIGGGDLDLSCINCTDIHLVTYTINQLYGRAGYETKWTRELLHRKYELADHLGNVRGVVSDRKLVSMEADLLSISNVYPFGMEMPGRSAQGEGYRYGFNTQEKDVEIGEGIYTAEFWEYDSRVARRWNIDPRGVKGVSEYAVFMNNPISFTDFNGDTIDVSTGLQADIRFGTQKKEMELISGLKLSIIEGKLQYAIDENAKGFSKKARKLLIKAIESEETAYMMLENEVGDELGGKYDQYLGDKPWKGGTMFLPSKPFGKNYISIDFKEKEGLVAGMQNFSESEKITFGSGMAALHEMHHFVHRSHDPHFYGYYIALAGGFYESGRFKGRTVRAMNRIRSEMGLPLRYAYSYNTLGDLNGNGAYSFIPFSKEANRSLRKDGMIFKGEKGIVIKR